MDRERFKVNGRKSKVDGDDVLSGGRMVRKEEGTGVLIRPKGL
jgi:hypothetical protein